MNYVLLLLCAATALTAEPLKAVSLQLQWKYQFQFAGYIMAKEKGFYQEAGLDVTIKEWDHNINMVDEVIEGRSEYAVSRPTSMIDIYQGKQILYLATIFQSSPLILLADKRSGITSVKDFKGKRIMTTGDLNTDTSLLSMMFSQGIYREDFETQMPSFNPQDLIDGKTDLMASYISNEPFVLEELGGDPVIFSPKDYGFDFYNDMLITGMTYYKNHPQEVKRFKSATLKGWRYAFSNIDETVNILHSKYNSQHKSKEALTYEANELKKLAYYKTNTLGVIEASKLEKIYNVYKLLGLVHEDISFNKHIYDEHMFDAELTTREKEYLKQKQAITMCVDPNWMPFEQFDDNGNYMGMAADYFKLFEKTLNASFNVIHTDSWEASLNAAKKRECDIMSLVMQTPERKKFLNFTSSYLKIPLVITTKLDVPFVNAITDLKDKKIGISKGYAFAEILRNKYPYLNIIEVDDIDDGLDRVNNRELFGYIGTLASVGYKFQTKYSGELKIAGKLNDNWELGVGVRNDDKLLLSIMQKAVNNLSHEEQQKILNKWVSIRYEKGVDYSLVWRILYAVLFISLLLIYWYRKLHIANTKLEETNRALEQTNADLIRTREKLREISITDKLTNLYNRHKIDEVLREKQELANRYNTLFSVIILDIDHFKQINDSFGHQAGDTVLQQFAALLLDRKRQSDIIGRWGGEEFILILPLSEKKDIIAFAESLRKIIDEHDFENVDHVTASVGATLYIHEEPIDHTISRADKALYRSKNQGRNQVNFL